MGNKLDKKAMIPKKILVVDDEPDLELLMRKKFRRRIKKKEFTMFFARHGQEALEVLDKEPDIDVILTDINMPEMDGLTLLEEVKTLKLPVRAIVMSAYDDMRNIRKAMNRGAFDFLTKPIDFKDLDITLEKSLEEVQLLKKGILAQKRFKKEHQKRLDAEASRRFKEQFLANMSHEIRTPMNAVVGITNILLKKDPRQEQVDYLKVIQQAANNLLVIINDILDISKIEAGKMMLEQTAFSLSNVLDGVMDTMQFRATEKDLELTLFVAEDVPNFFIGDGVRLNQILINLVGNAIKFTEKGKVHIEINREIPNNGEEIISFAVVDTGIGISEEKIVSIFQSFSQADHSINRKFGGTGLGLSISKQLIELHKGSLEVESEVGKGTTFTFTLPYTLPTQQQVDALQTANKVDNLPQISGLNILLVEDNLFNQVVAIDTLKMLIENLTIEVAENGRIALDMLLAKKYDIVLMDISMPEMDGYQATTHIRQKFDEPLAKIPIIAMTASATPAEINRCFQVGVDEYIAKPFSPDNLLQKIARLLKSELQSKNGKKTTTDTKVNMEQLLNGKVVDLTFLKKFTGGKPEKMAKYIKIFLKNAPNQVVSIQEHLATKDWERLRATAHALKSQLNYMGVFPVKKTIITIEQNAKEQVNLTELPDLVTKLDKVCQKAFKELKENLDSLIEK